LNGVVGKVKEGFNSALAKYKEGKQEVVQATEETTAAPTAAPTTRPSNNFESTLFITFSF